MVYTEERIDYYKSQIRRLRAIDKKITCRSVGEALGIDKDYAAKLINEVIQEGMELLDKAKALEAIEETRSRLEALNRELLEKILRQPRRDAEGHITNSSEILSERERVSAIKAIRENEGLIFDLLFKAGIFEKTPEKILLEHDMKSTSNLAEILNIVLGVVDHDTGYRITKAVSEYLKSSGRLEENNLEEQPTIVQ